MDSEIAHIENLLPQEELITLTLLGFDSPKLAFFRMKIEARQSSSDYIEEVEWIQKAHTLRIDYPYPLRFDRASKRGGDEKFTSRYPTICLLKQWGNVSVSIIAILSDSTLGYSY